MVLTICCLAQQPPRRTPAARPQPSPPSPRPPFPSDRKVGGVGGSAQFYCQPASEGLRIRKNSPHPLSQFIQPASEGLCILNTTSRLEKPIRGVGAGRLNLPNQRGRGCAYSKPPFGSIRGWRKSAQFTQPASEGLCIIKTTSRLKKTNPRITNQRVRGCA